MFDHIIYRGKTNFKKKKKIILVFIRKQPGEVDWILPVLYKLKENFNIIIIFEKYVALKLLKQNKILFNLFEKIVFCYAQNSYIKSIFYRISYKIVNFFKINFLASFFQNKIYEKYYNINDLNLKIKKTFNNFDIQKIKILMQDFTDNSPWIKKFSEKNSKLKIINYPHTTNIYSKKKFKIKNKINFDNSSYLFLSSSSDLTYFKKKFIKSYIINCGFPKYDKSWLKKLESSYKIKKERKKSIFVAYKGFEKEKYSKKKYIDQVKSLFDFAINEKEILLVFKFHPNAQEEKVFLSVANKYPKSLWKITKDHQHIAAKKYTIFVNFYNSASTLEALASGKVPIELSCIRKDPNEKSVYSDLKICFRAKNSLNLNKYLKRTLYEKNLNEQKKILKKFSKICNTNDSINRTNKIVLKISKTVK